MMSDCTRSTDPIDAGPARCPAPSHKELIMTRPVIALAHPLPPPPHPRKLSFITQPAEAVHKRPRSEQVVRPDPPPGGGGGADCGAWAASPQEKQRPLYLR